MPFVGELVALNALADTLRPRHAEEDVVGAREDGVFAATLDDRLLVLFGDLDALRRGEKGGTDPGAVGAGGEDGGERAA